jgi:hypothetical protein
MNGYPPPQMVVIVTYEVAKICTALEHIHAQRREMAIEQLEQGLDMSVMYLDDMLKKAQPADQKTLRIALKAIRMHWRRHPRQIGGRQDRVQSK